MNTPDTNTCQNPYCECRPGPCAQEIPAGFVPWNGKFSTALASLPEDSPVRVICRDGTAQFGTVGAFSWAHKDCGSDIVSYELLPTHAPEVVEQRVAERRLRVTAPTILEQAAQHMRDRAATYDKPEGERSMAAAAQAFNIIVGRTGDRALSESEGWLFMQVLKDVRDRQRAKPHRDSLEDCTAYSALKAEARLNEDGGA